MIILELILLGLTYTTLTVALFLQVICYFRNKEEKETIAFTASLMLLIVSMSLSPLFQDTGKDLESSITTLLCMILVGVTTLFNIIKERIHGICTKQT